MLRKRPYTGHRLQVLQEKSSRWKEKTFMNFETRCVHVGVDKDSAYKSCITPIYPTSTFAWDDLETNRGYDYTRSGNPTRKALEENIASLEGGIDCKATSTGMSAITAAVHLFQPGDHLIAGHDIYGGTYRLFADVYSKWGFKFSFVNMGDPENVRKAITPATKGIWIETPSNPLLNLVDLAAVTKIAGEAGVITIADNTFMSPYLQRPFEFGVDVVVHSTTKYLNGHSDVVGGCVVTRVIKLHAERVAYIVNFAAPQELRLLAVRCLAGAAGRQDAGASHAGPRAGRAGGRQDAQRASGRRARLLPGASHSSPSRVGQTPAAGLRQGW